jgi:hypothetical protein
MPTERKSWFVRQSSLAILSAKSSGSKQEERAKGMMNFALRSIFVHILACDLFTCHEILRHGASGFIPRKGDKSPGRNVCCEFLSPLKIIASAGYEPSNFGSNGKHAKHYTTEVTKNVMELEVLFLVDAYYILQCMTANEIDCYFQEWGRRELFLHVYIGIKRKWN